MKRTLLLLLVSLGLAISMDAQIPTAGLVASYPFNGNANDESVNANNGIVDGALLTTDRNGVESSAYLFDGIDDCIRITGGLPITNVFTISFWAYTENPGDYSNILCDGSSNAGGADFLINFRGDNLGIRADKNAGLNYEDSSPPELQNLGLLNNWVHVVWLMTPASSTIYLNGAELITINEAGSNEGFHDDFSFIGARQVWSSPDHFFTGKIDDIFIYDRVLDNAEISALYDGSSNGTVTDIDGNVYNTIRIASQIWMTENLKTTRYSDGTPIPLVNTAAGWDALTLTSSAYCWYNDDINNREEHGALYSWAAALNGAEYSDADPSGVQGVCPEGWHLPSWSEWGKLIHYLDPDIQPPYYSGGGIAGGKMKEAGTEHWLSPNTGATNESGFTALPSGARGGDGAFLEFGTGALWWSASLFGSGVHSRAMFVGHDAESYSMYSTPGDCGVSVRCLQDQEYVFMVDSVTVDNGEPAEVPVRINYVSEVDFIIAFQFDIDYDESMLEYTGFDLTGTLGEGGTAMVNDAVAGHLSVSYMNSAPLDGEGELIKLQFNTLTADTTDLLLSNAYLNNIEVENLLNGAVIVRDTKPPSAAITYSEAEVRCGDELIITAEFSEPMLAANDVLISMSGASSLVNAVMTRQNESNYFYHYPVPRTEGLVTLALSNGTDLWGNELVSEPISGADFTIVGLNLGDVDDDGLILAYDAALTLQHSVGLDPLPLIDPLPWENWRDSTANVDGAGGITANDAGMILQYSAGIINSFTSGAKKSTSQAFISMEFVNDGIVFYSYGDLVGLNISFVEDIHILGTPEVLTDNFMSANNIGESVYKLGLCTANPPADGEAILKIPVTQRGSVEIHMIINTISKLYTLNLTTEITQFDASGISLYPNPVGDLLSISGLTGETLAKIYNVNGQLMFSKNLVNDPEEINVSELPSGFYIIRMNTGNKIVEDRFIKE